MVSEVRVSQVFVVLRAQYNQFLRSSLLGLFVAVPGSGLGRLLTTGCDCRPDDCKWLFLGVIDLGYRNNSDVIVSM